MTCADQTRSSVSITDRVRELLRRFPRVTAYLRKSELREYRISQMNVYLKIKVKSLAAEAQLIRAEEARIKRNHAKWRARAESRKGTAPPASFFNIKSHRTNEVRKESRSSCLAYGFLRGNDYRAMEVIAHTQPDWKRVESLVSKYGEGDPRDRMQRFSEWKEAA